MEKSLVSIVTPCYNGENYLDRFLQSVLAQSYPNLELIFINDGSTDHTEEKVFSYKDQFDDKNIRFIYQKQENAGQAAALNKGLKLFAGDYLACLDSDDEINPEFIEKRVEYLDSHSECSYCYGKAVTVNEDNPNTIVSIIGKRALSGDRAFFEDILYVHNVFFPGYLFKTAAFDKAIRNRDIFIGRGGQNAQILLPMAWYYGEPGYVEESVYKYYMRSSSHSHNQKSSEKIIEQLEKYETILIETIKRIPDSEAQKYIEAVKKYYARWRFGNAVDTMNGTIILKYYRELKEIGIATTHDKALCLKYSARSILKAREE
ncbi:MAG: glycosyltransferase [Erysipelotrichaceae bacterium]|nr:glycosyltransferase [Erysipelotrichaceae bacterium]